MRRLAPLAGLVAALVTTPAAAELTLPPGFSAQVYVSGQGFDSSSEHGVYGIPAIGTLAFDGLGTLYLARTGTRFRSGDTEDFSTKDFSTILRIPAGGARLTPETEARHHFGPPLRNPQVAAARGRGEVFVTTYDRDRKIGVLYRLVDGRPHFLAGGTPLGGAPPLLRHPEGVTFDTVGHIYVTDRDQGVVVRLDRSGRAVSERHLEVMRPRAVAADEAGHLWVATDGSAETPWQDGAGQLWRAAPDGALTLVLTGPLPGGIALSPAGTLFMSQRRAGKIFGKNVAWEEFEAQRAWEYRKWANQLGGTVPEEFRPMIEQQVWDRLILLEQARRRKLGVDNAELAAYIRQQAVFQQEGRFVPDHYKRVLMAIGLHPNEFERRLRDKKLGRETLRA